MNFTYDSYRQLINNLQKHGYDIVSYHNWMNSDRCAILRHDIDNDLEKAVELAKIERDLGINSTYFVLLSSDFYNVFSAKSEKYLISIMKCGHEIGLHFDEVRYPNIKGFEDIIDKIVYEAGVLSNAINAPISCVSMHRPSKLLLDKDISIPGIINSYGSVFFNDFKYLSDSRRYWREPINDLINTEAYDRFHILTHPIWYNHIEKDIHDTISSFINDANYQRYMCESENIKDLNSIMSRNEVR